jgi:hypothetical protein
VVDSNLQVDIISILDQKYRNINGTCNNLRNPKMGVVFGPLQRLIPNAYADGELTNKMRMTLAKASICQSSNVAKYVTKLFSASRRFI